MTAEAQTQDTDVETAGPELEDLEVELLLEGLSIRYGSDFRGYARSALKRRVRERVRAEEAGTVSGLQARVLHDARAMSRLVAAFTTHDTGMFRDPGFFLTFRRQIVPLLRTYPFVRIWHAGCSSGEEVYSMAILLAEENLASRVRIYATDLSETMLARAKAGMYPSEQAATYETRYQRAGGRRALADYVTMSGGAMTLAPSLRENVVFGQHNLATDRSFNEFNVVLCRNVMIHYTRQLQRQVHELLHASLCRLGVLGLGGHESLRGSGQEDSYEAIDAGRRLYRRVG